jgi:aspartate aminotransferase
MPVIDTRPFLKDNNERLRISLMSQSLQESEILKIAGQIRGMIREGKPILNLTIGDFSSAQFPVPSRLLADIKTALDEGHTNYPPATGVLECRQAVQELFKKRLNLDYPMESILIAGGARPMIAGTYLALVDKGDKVIYPLPSWNNNHYTTFVGAEAVEIATTPENKFFPKSEDIKAHLGSARLICLNSPLNPTGTVVEPEALKELCLQIVEENRRRETANERSLYLMYDQVYWMLTHGDTKHQTPVELVPEMAAYTIFVDGISKGFAATGLRVGWAVGPKDVISKMASILTHVGAWAPRPEQIATAKLLQDDAAMTDYKNEMGGKVLARLKILADGINALKSEGHNVEAIAPAGAIYLSIRIGVAGKTTPDGKILKSDEDVRVYLLMKASIGLVPFFCFGLEDRAEGWFRVSVGTVSEQDCHQTIENLSEALRALS